MLQFSMGQIKGGPSSVMGGLTESSKTKGMGGLGLKYLTAFASSLAEKLGWRLISMEKLWTTIIKRKYIDLMPTNEWLRNPYKRNLQASVVWKENLDSIGIIEQGLAWNVSNGEKIILGLEPWVGCNQGYALSREVITHLHLQGCVFLNQIEKEGHKRYPQASFVWKETPYSMKIIEQGLSWHVCNGEKIKLSLVIVIDIFGHFNPKTHTSIN